MPEEIHNQYMNGGRAEKAKLLKMFVDSGLDKALGSKRKMVIFGFHFPRNEQTTRFMFLIAKMFTLLRLFEMFEKCCEIEKGYPGAMPPYMACVKIWIPPTFRGHV